MPHLLVDISFHGYGHVSQVAPVLKALHALRPELQITVRTMAPESMLRQRLSCNFTHIQTALDFGMVMSSAVDIEIPQSAAAYRAFHSNWNTRIQDEAAAMRKLKPDLLLADIPYLSLAAAQHAGIPAVALCSLNWADVYQHYCNGNHFDPDIHSEIIAAYQSAQCFLQPQPSMPMPELRNTRRIAPIARIGQANRARIDQHHNQATAGKKLILVGMGGMEFRLPMLHWPRLPDVHWLVPAAWGIQRDDISTFDAIGMPFSDLLASSDAVLTKPGYGTFSEAACAGVALFSLKRPDWPEEPYLVSWLNQNGVCIEVERADLHSGDWLSMLSQAWSSDQRPTPPQPSGALEAAQYLHELLG